MKKALSFLLCLCVVCGALVCLCGLTVSAAADYSTPVREPVTVTFDSSVAYENPYRDVRADVTFTHEDGTTLSLPCFWYHDNTYAFRFSPTKEGLWKYQVTCSDAANTSLNVSGTIEGTPAKGDTETSKRGFLTVPDGSRFLYYEDGTPFFWLGDTNWQAPSTNSTTVCNYPGCTCGGQYQHIVSDRAAKGFTVYQTYFSDFQTVATQGNKSYWEKSGKLPRAEVFNERIDFEFQYLHEKDLVAAVGFGCHRASTNNMSKDEMMDLARYIVARYACYNVVWIAGQEVTELEHAAATKNEDVTAMDVYMAICEMVEEIDGYKHPNSAHMRPMTSDHELAQRLGKTDWHDLWLLQGGHDAHVREKEFYRSYFANMYVTPDKAVKPYIEGELNYEEINCNNRFNGYVAPRWSAWNAMLCGTAGFTYGVSGIWVSCFSTSKHTGFYDGDTSYSYEPWYMGVDKPGSLEVGYMRRFFEDLPDWTKLVPAFYDTSVADFAEDEKKLVSLTEDKSVIVSYFYNTDDTTGTLFCLDPQQQYYALWYDTLTGRYQPAGLLKEGATRHPIGSKPTNGDWVFLLTSRPIRDFYAEDAYVPKTNEVTVSGTKVTPASFKAVNGVTYNNKQEIQDPTQNLLDGDETTVWEPSADRVTLTFYYDLGKAMDLTCAVITPKAGTTIPDWRVYASNDETTWTLLSDTQLNGTKHKSGESFAETLSGGYRYVKVLILGANTLTAEEAAAYPYETHHNPLTNQDYSHTALTELALYAGGESASPVTLEKTGGAFKGIRTAEGESGPSAEPGTETPEPSTDEAKHNPWPAVILAVAVAAIVAAVVLIVVFVKNKKKNS